MRPEMVVGIWVAVLVAVVAGVLATLLQWPVGLRDPWNHWGAQDWAAWVQVFGSVGAILASAWVARYSARMPAEASDAATRKAATLQMWQDVETFITLTTSAESVLFALERSIGTRTDGRVSVREAVEHGEGRLRASFDDQGALIAAEVSADAAPASLTSLVDALKLRSELLSDQQWLKGLEVDAATQGRRDPRALAVALTHSIAFRSGNMHADVVSQRWMSDLRQVESSEVANAWNSCFAPGGVGIAVVGSRPDVSKALSRVVDQWPVEIGTKSAPTRNAGRGLSRAPGQAMIDVPRSTYGFFIARSTLAVSENDPRYAAMAVANQLIGGSPAARLFEQLRDEQGLSYSIASFLSPQLADRKVVFGIYASFSPQQADAFRHAIEASLSSAKSTTFSAGEVRSTAASMLRERRQSLRNDVVVASALATQSAHGGSMNDVDRIDRALERVTESEVSRAARVLLDPRRMQQVFAFDAHPTSDDQAAAK